jgi:isopenicillin-N epimerase
MPETVEHAHPDARHWSISPDCVYLNHGSFGPSPLPVRSAREKWSERLERQPMQFFCREMEEEMERTATHLAAFLKTLPDRIVLVDNATVAMNIVAASLKLKPGDEVILTDHEYGAVRNIWQARCADTGARIVAATLPFPLSNESIVNAIEQTISPKTRLIVVSHVTSATACILPIADICRMAAQRRLPVCVDGPHALAMLDIDLEKLGCDFYCGSCHKWLSAPFGSGFLWVHPRHHADIRSPVMSWDGSIAGRPASWKDRTNWLGTRDPAPMLAISAALDFMTPDRIQAFRNHAHTLVADARRRLLEIPGSGPFCTNEETDFVSMAAVELPQTGGWKPGYHGHPDALQLALRDRHGIEVLMGCWKGRRFLRISAHLYTTQRHINLLVNAVRELL